jgi:hypothetical protein
MSVNIGSDNSTDELRIDPISKAAPVTLYDTSGNEVDVNKSEISFKDGANLDSFSRLRISNPLTLFNAQMTYDLVPLLYEQITNGSGATISHDTTNRCALMTFSSTPTGGKSYMQSFEYLPYQPGKSQLVFVTFNMISGVSNVTKFAGLSDGTNGFEFQVINNTNQFTIYSASGNGNETVTQANWNIDKLDGTGPSGIVLDISKTQILVIDFQALYVGRVRMGFDIGGTVIYCHEFLHSNLSSYPYIQTANLPVRCGMTSTATVTTTMNFICCSVISEGGVEDVDKFGYSFSQGGSVTASSGARTHLLSLRPRATFNSFTNRTRVAYIDVEIFVTGTRAVYWELCIGQAISGTTTYNDVNTTYSSVEYNTAGTISGSPTVVIDAGWVAASGSTNGLVNTTVASRYPITLNAAGAARSLGTLTLLVTGIGGTSDCSGSIKFKEIR